jgi:hypothetical protein
LNPRKAPRGRPVSVAMRRAKPETLRERKIIASKSSLRWRISESAVLKPSMSEFMYQHHPRKAMQADLRKRQSNPLRIAGLELILHPG